MKKLILTIFALAAISATAVYAQDLVILHLNDTHSHIDPERSGKNAGHAGVVETAAYVDEVRAEVGKKNVLLLHAGDFSQGTSYFTELNGDMEIEVLNSTGYDVVCLGNHEFDNGVDTLAVVLKDAQFAVVCANYDVTNSPLEDIVKPYTILRRAGMKIGVFGLGINPKGLVAEHNFYPLQYLDPVEAAQKTADILKHQKHCDVVICLSHLGTHSNDINLAKATKDIDIIIGGHTHKIVENLYVPNMEGDSVLLAQTGKAGARIGKITLNF